MGIEEALKSIEKNFGEGTLVKLSDSPIKIETISSGSLLLDRALGGGIPRGRIVEIIGAESAGKTTLAYHIIAEAQKDGECAFIDAEHSLDPEYASRIGVDLDKLYVCQPDNGEEALEVVDTLVRSGGVRVVVVDSVSALVPRAEIDGEMGASNIGLQARLMSQAMRKLAGFISKTNTTVVFINQIRNKIGVMYGSNETTSGGNALKFYSTIRLDLRRIEQLKTGDVSTGNRVRARVIKNKIAPPFKTAEFDIVFGEGINKEGEIIDLTCERKGSWFTVDGKQIQGRDKAIQYLKDNPKIKEKLNNQATRQKTT